MKKVIWLIITMIGFIIYKPYQTMAQQDAQYTQYMYNMNILNPAYAGSKMGQMNVSLLGRSQWVGIPGAPQTATLSVHSNIIGRMGLGLSVYADKVGPVNEQFVFADYSYRVPVGYYDNIAFGIKVGASILNASLSDLNTISTLQDIVDPNLRDIGNIKPNFGFGAFYYSDIYYAGFSIPNLLNTVYLEKEGGVVTEVSRKKHAFLTGGYVFDLDNIWQFKPSFMAKYTAGTPLSVDLSANFLYDGAYEVGASYRWDDSVSLVLGAKVTDNIRVGYSYDFTVSDLAISNGGTHELILLFDFFTTYEIISPRFF